MFLHHARRIRPPILALLALLTLAQTPVLAADNVSATALTSDKGPSIAIGSVGFYHEYLVPHPIDLRYKAELNAAGYQVKGMEYADVTPTSIQPFNILALQWTPGEGNTAENAVYDQKIPVFEEYVRNGGGLLITYESAYATYKALNRLLKVFGAEVLNESITDEKNSTQQKAYLHYTFAKTTNLNRSSPLTAGLDSFTYPTSTSPLRLSPDWQPVIVGDASAHSASVPQKPALVASRSYGKGRIVVMSMHTTFFINAGYHRIWGGITMQGGGARFLDNTYRWLAETSTASGFGGYHEPAPKPGDLQGGSAPASQLRDVYNQLVAANGRPPVLSLVHHGDGYLDYTGLIGARTHYSTGRGTVADYVREAKVRGFSFLVFTEDFPPMNEEKWNALAADCKAASDATFCAIPGIAYQDGPGNHLICFAMPHWPNKEWLNKAGDRVEDAPGMYFGMDWVPVYLEQPRWNPTRPWYHKFYTGMAVYSYPRGDAAPVEDWDEYLQVQSNVYNLVPIADHALYSPEDVAVAQGYVTHVMARKTSEIANCFRYTAYEQRRAYVSSGPIIHEFAMDNSWSTMPMGGGYNVIREAPWLLTLDVSSDAPITDVILYDQKRIFYHFRPHSTEFKQSLKGYHDQQRFLTMEVIDARGRRAISSGRYTNDVRQVTFMCGDQQNTLNNMAFVNREGKPDFCSAMGNYVTGWDGLGIGVIVPNQEMFPAGLDYIVGGFGGGLAPAAYGPPGLNGPSVAQRDIVFGSGDVNILDHHFLTSLAGPGGSYNVPSRDYAGTVRMIEFTPRLYSYNMMVLQTRVDFKRSIAFPAQRGPNLSLLRVNGPEQSFGSYSYINPAGHKISGLREKDAIPSFVPRGGYVSIWPDFYGSAAIYPLQDAQNPFVLQGPNIEIGADLGGTTVPAGTSLHNSFLLVRGKFGEDGDSGFDRIRNSYGLDGHASFRILSRSQQFSPRIGDRGAGLGASDERRSKRGVLTPTNTHEASWQGPFPVLQASNYNLSARITPSDLPNDLPVEVQGINPNWDAGMYDRREHRLRRIGVFENTGCFTADITHGLDFAAGNLLISDQPNVHLHLWVSPAAGKGGSFVEVEAHNPTAHPRMTEIWGSPAVPWLASFHALTRLRPGDTRIITMPLAHPLRWTETGVVDSFPDAR